MTNTKTAASGGFPLAGLLGLIFITLKLCGVIAWSWWWVLAPFWIPLALFIAFLVIAGLVVVGIALFNKRK